MKVGLFGSARTGCSGLSGWPLVAEALSHGLGDCMVYVGISCLVGALEHEFH